MGKDKIYDISFSDSLTHKNILSKYIPMQWSPSIASGSKVTDYLEKVKNIANKTKYVLSWNEPDMTGTILPGPATGQGDTGGSSAGIWFADTFVYGNAKQDDLKSIPSSYENTSFKQLGEWLEKESSDYKSIISDIKITTPVTANGPFLDDKNICVTVKPFKQSDNYSIFCNGNDTKGHTPNSIQITSGDKNDYLLSQPCGSIWGDGPANSDKHVKITVI